MSFFDIVAQLSDSMLRSTWIFLLTLVFSMPLGLLICVARMYAWKPVQWLMKFYISVVRGTPLMLQLLVIYFGKYFLFGLPLTTNYRFWAVIIAFSLNYAAYFAEIFRSGIQSIPVGQHEAAKILGYKPDAEIPAHYYAADDKACSSGSDQRVYHTGQGHFPGICNFLHRIVHRNTNDRCRRNIYAALSGCCNFLLCL